MKHNRYYIFIFIAMAISLSVALNPSATMVTDQLGRQVTIPERPNRIISLAPNITEIIYALEQQHRLVGVTRFSDYPPKAVNLPKVGSYVYLDLERIVGLKPDLCIAIKDGNPKVVVDRLESLSIPVYAVDPRDLDAVMDTIVEIGNLLDSAKIAKNLVTGMASRVKKVAEVVSKTTHKPGVFFQIGISPIVSIGSATFIHQLIERAGGNNLAKGSTPYPRFSREKVVALAPDVMIISSMARMEAFDRIKAEWSQ